MGEPSKQNVAEKKPGTQGYIRQDSICIKFKNRQNYSVVLEVALQGRVTGKGWCGGFLGRRYWSGSSTCVLYYLYFNETI